MRVIFSRWGYWEKREIFLIIMEFKHKRTSTKEVLKILIISDPSSLSILGDDFYQNEVVWRANF